MPSQCAGCAASRGAPKPVILELCNSEQTSVISTTYPTRVDGKPYSGWRVGWSSPVIRLSDWGGTGFGNNSFLSTSTCMLFEWSIAMKGMNRKWCLALVLLCLAATTACPTQDEATLKNNQRSKENLKVPEGGSSLVYVLGAGVTCLGAMLVRSRSAKPKKS
jgi:hypothetical protein